MKKKIKKKKRIKSRLENKKNIDFEQVEYDFRFRKLLFDEIFINHDRPITSATFLLQEELKRIEAMPITTCEEVIDKYIAHNIFFSSRRWKGKKRKIWLGCSFLHELNRGIELSQLNKEEYMYFIKAFNNFSKPLFTEFKYTRLNRKNKRIIWYT